MPAVTARLALAGSLLLVSWLSLPRSAAAQDDAQQTAIARSLFEEGLAHFDAGELELAVDRFRRSLEIRRSSAVLFNLARAINRARDGGLGRARPAVRGARGAGRT